ncbi:MAG: hypothetical protein FJ106_03480 [Deltaproteobacteria bacterium]|nr:hypothetical protein [Deltaproteobacteria bacterium]
MTQDFVSQVVFQSKEFLLERDIATVFPLFTPEGEKLWAPGWTYTNLIGSTELKPDDVFLTDTHDHKFSQAIWIVSDYDASKHYVSYYKIEPEQKVGKITVQCFEKTPSVTLVRVTYKYIGLSDSGNQFVAGFTKEAFAEFIGVWHTLLRDYFLKNP